TTAEDGGAPHRRAASVGRASVKPQNLVSTAPTRPGWRFRMSGRLANKTAFVTAAGQGIGRATALAFAAAGARVIATDIDAAKVQAIANDSIHAAALDVLRADDIARAARDAGAIDILFNCAGFVHQGTLLEATD